MAKALPHCVHDRPTLPDQVGIIHSYDCGWIFQRIQIFPRIAGGTRVEWYLHPDFRDPPPHTFQLYWGQSDNPQAPDWSPVGLSAEDTYWLVDDQQRVWGKTQVTHYMISLTSALGTYYSRPWSPQGVWTFQDWRRALACQRAERIAMRAATGQDGYFFKRKNTGEPCPVCLDFATKECRNAQCGICMGTGFVGGYYAPVYAWANLDEEAAHEKIDGSEAGVGMVRNVLLSARMLAPPQLNEQDVWVDSCDDKRYFIHEIKSAMDIRGVPVIYDPVKLRLAAYSDTIYALEIPGQVPDV